MSTTVPIPLNRNAEITCFLLDAIKEAHEDYKRGRKRTVHGLRLVNDAGYIRMHALIWQHQLRRSFSGEEIAATLAALVDCGSLIEARDEHGTPTGFYRDATIARDEVVPSKRGFMVVTRARK